MFQPNASKFATLEKAMSVVISLMKKKQLPKVNFSSPHFKKNSYYVPHTYIPITW